ncbi:hypothetical protein [Synechocystis sp. PCC 7509]|uniref:hypothetical protein n=1 Tax=Synechocystis sp. PCC 7509 TaxID=927677 RepID=UPI0002ACEBB9|nr:hypothetical protein [Synechocystis sp. PCC 7509]
MQAKQKVTFYLTPEIHRRLKIRSAIDSEPMSELAEKAIGFYLTHPEMVEELETIHGRTHQLYACPECATTVVISDGEMVAIGSSSGVLNEEKLTVAQVTPGTAAGQEELVPCLK